MNINTHTHQQLCLSGGSKCVTNLSVLTSLQNNKQRVTCINYMFKNIQLIGQFIFTNNLSDTDENKTILLQGLKYQAKKSYNKSIYDIFKRGSRKNIRLKYGLFYLNTCQGKVINFFANLCIRKYLEPIILPPDDFINNLHLMQSMIKNQAVPENVDQLNNIIQNMLRSANLDSDTDAQLTSELLCIQDVESNNSPQHNTSCKHVKFVDFISEEVVHDPSTTVYTTFTLSNNDKIDTCSHAIKDIHTLLNSINNTLLPVVDYQNVDTVQLLSPLEIKTQINQDINHLDNCFTHISEFLDKTLSKY